MQLRKMVVMLSALGALSLMTSACDGGDTDTANTCSDDTGCLETEICHPTAKVCVTKCTSRTDCTDNAPNCAPVTPGSSVSVCQCSTTQLCNTDRETADQVCSDVDKVCVKACAADTDCPTGRTCDTATGQCKAGTTTTSCQGTAQSTCAYGQYCSTNVCTAAPVAEASTCQNFSSNRPAWDAATNKGPVIYSVTKTKFVAQGNQTCTSSQGEVHVSVRAYRTDQDWPATKSALTMGGFFYVRTDTQRRDVLGDQLLVPDAFGGGYFRDASNPKVAEFRVYLCPPSGTTSLPVGFFFTDGNPVCATISQ